MTLSCWNKPAAQAGNTSTDFASGDYFTGCTPVEVDVSTTPVATAGQKKLVWVLVTTTATTGYRYHPLIQAFDADGTSSNDDERNMSAYIDRAMSKDAGYILSYTAAKISDAKVTDYVKALAKLWYGNWMRKALAVEELHVATQKATA
jgi:hypothetical protein